jgi:rfaE bifunctional protein nucleotidyltransferase chain/domain
MNKIIPYDNLPLLRSKHRDKTIVLCHGCFDVIHPGHIDHLDQAKQLGDILVVTITADEFVSKKQKPFFSHELRAKQVASLDMVDYVSIIFESSALTPIQLLRPDFYVKGKEFEKLLADSNHSIGKEKELVEQQGGQIYFTNEQPFSPVKVGYFLQDAPEAIQEMPFYFSRAGGFRDLSDRMFNADNIRRFKEIAATLNVCVIGETIIDEWRFVDVYSVSHKSKCLTGEERSVCRQIGGAGIIGMHLANFAGHVDLYTNVAEDIAGLSNLNVVPVAEGEVVKTRFVNRENNVSIFENKRITISNLNWQSVLPLRKYDAIIVSDFGHGLIDGVIASRLREDADGLFAVMVQANSSNYGFNLPTKFRSADYFCMNRLEAELCIRRRGIEVEEILKELRKQLQAEYIAVTLSNEGVIISSHKDGTYKLPALSQTVVDTIGCGDAFLAFSSLALAAGPSIDIASLAGSIGSAIMAQKFCNDSPVTVEEFDTVATIII